MINSKLYYGNGNVKLLNPDSAMAIEIHFNGDCSLHSNLGRKWIFKHNKGKLLIINIEGKPFSKELIFKYRGVIRIVSCKLVNMELQTHNASIIVENVHLWSYMNNEWDTSENLYKYYKNTHKYKNPLVVKERKSKKVFTTKTMKISSPKKKG